MEISNNSDQSVCLICLENQSEIISLPNCLHKFCLNCLKDYLNTLKKYNLINPDKLICLSEQCKQQIPDAIINKIYPGEEGFILNIVRKKYKQSKDPSIKIFNCKGFTKLNRQPLIDKPATLSRQNHTKLMNQKISNILSNNQIVEDKKICTNVLSFNKLNIKDKMIQCYVCGVSYCPRCENFSHQNKCEMKNQQDQLKKYIKNNKSNEENNHTDIEAFIKANDMSKCLNPKCGFPIIKEQGCYWVKCRCSWEFCYPCQKLWGDCQHFAKYPYKKFTPPPEWMVKALKLY